jgi:hypothetical protein
MMLPVRSQFMEMEVEGCSSASTEWGRPLSLRSSFGVLDGGLQRSTARPLLQRSPCLLNLPQRPTGMTLDANIPAVVGGVLSQLPAKHVF